MSEEVVWLERIFWMMGLFGVMLAVDIGLLLHEINVLKKRRS